LSRFFKRFANEGPMSKSAQELTRKEIKGPDKFQEAAKGAAEWAAGKEKVILAAAAGLLVLVAAGIGVSSWLDSRKAAAGGELYRAAAAASGEISSVPLPGIDRPVFASLEQKYRAQVDAAERVQKEHGGSRAAVSAALLAGSGHLALKEWDAAAAAFQRYLAEAPADDSLRYAAFDGLARAQEGKGDLDAAAKTWEQAAGVAFFKDRATLERARLLAKAGKADEARKALEGVAKESALAPEAQERLARLGAAP
jgi:predicted negative regulator of RcsB-dependent stress response